MPFRGFGPSGSGGADGGRDQGARRNPIEQSEEELRATIRDIISDGHDAEVQGALRQTYHALQDDRRPSPGVVINKVAQLVNLGGDNISPREAILRMASARYDYSSAARAYLEELEDGSFSSLSPPRERERDEDPEKVKGKGEEDRRMSDNTEEAQQSSSGVSKYPGEIDSREPGGLNRWRSQMLRRNIGGSRPYRQEYHETEKDWLLQEHVDFERKRLAEGKPVDYSAMRWSEIAKRFNRRFEDQYLSGVIAPRPSRTKVSLRTESYRVKKIIDFTGLSSRMHSRREGLKLSQKKLAEKDESEDEMGSSEAAEDSSEDKGGEEERDPRGTRRGDPPPGKTPWRKDEDDDWSGGIRG